MTLRRRAEDRIDDAPPRPEGLIARERRSFGYAFAGLAHAAATQRHLVVHLGLGAVAIALGAWLGLTAVEWALLALTIAVVVALELINTVVEAAVDLASPGYHALARAAKDVAAAAVLVAAIGAMGVGAALFGPRLLALLSR